MASNEKPEEKTPNQEQELSPSNDKIFTLETEDDDGSSTESIFDEEVVLPAKVEEGIKQLEAMFDKCQALLNHMKSLTLHVAGSFGEVVKAQYQVFFEREVERRQQSFEDKLQQERGRSSKKMQATRNDCQKVVHQMAGTVKTYFRRAMEEVRINHKRELEEARKDGYKNGMHRQRELLHSNMICSQCATQEPDMFVCSGCWSACYCGSECQKEHWHFHEKQCGWNTADEASVTSQGP